MKITIKCPKCDIGMDIELESTENPIFEEYYLDAFKSCANCETVIHASITGNEKQTNLPF